MWHRDGVGFACFSRDGSFIATASEDFTSSIWGFRRRQVLQHAHEVRCVSFSPDSKWVATASIDHTARVWDPETGMPLTPLLRHLLELSGVRFVPGGSKIITWASTGDSWVWRLATDQRPAEDLKMLSEVLLSGTVTASNPMEFPKSAQLLENFEKLRQKYPDNFVITREQVETWKDFYLRQN